MNFLQSISGMIRVKLISADPAAALNAVHRSGISVYQAEYSDPMSITLTIRRCDYQHLVGLTQKRGEELKLLQRLGAYWSIVGLRKRKLLLSGLSLYLLLVMLIPGRVLFVRVEGNNTVPTKLIVEKASQCGIDFGATRREVRSERMKNALLGAIPELQWAGVNTYGCIAVISVRERTEPAQVQTGTGLSSIVAVRDAYITSATVQKGNALCRVGQTVKAGQVLVSGYTDCGLSIRVTRSEAEIFGQTQWNLSVVTPAEVVRRGQTARVDTKFSLIIGKKRINFYKDSGILDSSCVKMYSERYVTLPGGFELPLAIVTERWVYYDCVSDAVSEESARQITEEFAQRYLGHQMVAGQITASQTNMQDTEGAYCLEGHYTCLEMIGRERIEEIITENEQNDRTNG